MLKPLLAPLRFLAVLTFSAGSCLALDLSVPAGGDIQSAINRVSDAGGGTVGLAAGTYPLTETLLIKSKVHLTGKGPGQTTIAGGDFTVIRQAAEGLTDVRIEHLRVTGEQTKACYGILIESTKVRHENISIDDVEITHTGMGMHLKRATHVVVSNSRIHHNGAKGFERYFHNLYIRSCDDVRVTGCNLDNGTSGNGLNVSYCTDVSVTNTTACDNYFRGMRAAETDGFIITGCTITGNGGTGLIINQEKGTVTKRLVCSGNTVSQNHDGGIRVLQGATGRVLNNTAVNNQKFDYQIPADIEQSDNH
jgi:parallel beta-helix repeat protein